MSAICCRVLIDVFTDTRLVKTMFLEDLKKL